jgi:hypothetical protein
VREEDSEDQDDLDGFEKADREKEAKYEVKEGGNSNNRVSKSAHPSVRNKLNSQSSKPVLYDIT